MQYSASLYAHLSAYANPDLALPMQRYMRHKFPFFGIKTPEREALVREFLVAHGKPKPGHLEQVCRDCWHMPQREMQYVAMKLCLAMKKQWGEGSIGLMEWMATTKPWWDTVDYIASNLMGTWLKNRPQQIHPIVLDWLGGHDMWLWRCALLFQLKYRMDTDTALLSLAINQLRVDNEFFIQKAIGWALRQYGHHNPAWVLSFVHNTELKPLAKREALRIIKLRT